MRQRTAQVAGSFIAGFGAGLGALLPFDTGNENVEIVFLKCSMAGLITSIPRLTKVLEEYGRQRR